MKQIQQSNQQLTDRQQRLSQVIVQGGNETEVSFAKKTIDFVKIKDLDDDDFEIGLSLLLTRIVNLLGIKEAVSDLNKQDIVEMLDIGFKNLSLQEVNYAFKLERYNQLDPKTEHFQLFNAEYVSEVLKKYKKWLQNIRRVNNLPIAKEKESVELSQEEKDLIVYQGCVGCFDEWNQTKIIANGYSWVHDHLTDLELLHFTSEEKSIMWKKAKSNLIKKSKELSRDDARDLLRDLQLKDSSKRKIEYKLIRTIRYFEKIHAKGKHLKEFI